MRYFRAYFLVILMFLLILIPSVSAWNDTWVCSGTTTISDDGIIEYLVLKNVENWQKLKYVYLYDLSATLIADTSADSCTVSLHHVKPTSPYTDYGEIGTGVLGYYNSSSAGGSGDYVYLDITTWDIGSATGYYLVKIVYNPADLSNMHCTTPTQIGPIFTPADAYNLGLDTGGPASWSNAIRGSYWVYDEDSIPITPTPTPYPGTIAINLYEKYSNAILINQAITVTPTGGGDGETKTSLYGETLHFGVVPGMEYWFNATRTGYRNYNETYTIPADPGIYGVYMERVLPPIANHSYAHFSVVDQTNGGLIPNAEIRLSDGQTKLTNSAGYAWFSVNNSEQINYYVSMPSGYWPAYGAMNLTADESILVALQRYTGPTATATMPGWTPVTVPTTGTGVDPVVTLSAQLRQQNVQEGMDVWYTNLPFISQFLFLLFIIGGLGLMAGGTRRN